jgi:GNAT superfamily N-acetyltransferase
VFIRQADPADSAAIVDLRSILDLDRQEWLRGHVAAGEVLIASDEGDAILGYVVVDHSFFERFVQLLFVAESARRSGVGARLLAEAVERARPARVFTSTNLSNSPMHALLAKAGWTSAGMVEGLDEGDPEVFYFIDRAGNVR